MEFIIITVVFCLGMAFFALLTRKWGYRVGVGLAKKRMKDLGLDDEDKEAHE